MSTTKVLKDIETCTKRIESEYQPSTFKFVKRDGNYDILKSFFDSLTGKTDKYSIYLNEIDEVIDEKSIENDIAVVAKDFLKSLKSYDNGHTKNCTK